MEVLALGVLLVNPVFWLYTVGLIGILTWLAEGTDDGSPFFSLGVLAIYGGLLVVGFGISVEAVIAAVLAKPFMLIIGAIGYFGIGIAWGTWKWYRVLKKAAKKLKSIRDAFLEEQQIRNIPKSGTVRDLWNERLYANYGHSDEIAPEALNNKSRIISWMAYWPFSLAWSILADSVRWVFELLLDGLIWLYEVLRDTWNWLYDKLASAFGRMRRRLFSGLEDAM